MSSVAAGGTSPPRRRSALGALADFAATLVAIAQTRIALIEADLDQALTRLVVLLSWWVAGLLTLALGVAVGLAGLVLAAPPEDRVLILVGGSLLLLLVGAGALAVAVNRARRAPRWFAATFDELAKDHAILRSTPP